MKSRQPTEGIVVGRIELQRTLEIVDRVTLRLALPRCRLARPEHQSGAIKASVQSLAT